MIDFIGEEAVFVFLYLFLEGRSTNNLLSGWLGSVAIRQAFLGIRSGHSDYLQSPGLFSPPGWNLPCPVHCSSHTTLALRQRMFSTVALEKFVSSLDESPAHFSLLREKSLRLVTADFLGTGTTMADFRHAGTEASCRDRLEMSRNTPATW